MPAPDRDPARRAGGGPAAAAQLHVRGRGGRGPGQDHILPPHRRDAPGQGPHRPSPQRTMPKN